MSRIIYYSRRLHFFWNWIYNLFDWTHFPSPIAYKKNQLYIPGEEPKDIKLTKDKKKKS